MAEGKKSALVYCDFIHSVEPLTDEEAGKVFKHFLRYINDLNPQPPDRLTGLIFEPWKQSLKRDLRKWESICEKRSESGKLGAEAKRRAKEENPIKEHEPFLISKISRDDLMESLINGNEINEIARVTGISLDFVKSIIPLFRVNAELEYNSNKEFVRHFKNTVTKAYKEMKDNPIATSRPKKLT